MGWNLVYDPPPPITPPLAYLRTIPKAISSLLLSRRSVFIFPTGCLFPDDPSLGLLLVTSRQQHKGQAAVSTSSIVRTSTTPAAQPRDICCCGK
ncbi:hypothetical protein J6590_029615 [Homalodisca vitripennis]|nr:hypothetical protein J6590_029615 [Homalodisca vitripennis]